MSAAEPLDHRIVVEIQRLLRMIRKANGYRTDAGAYVLSDEVQSDVPDDQAFLEVLDEDEEAEFQTCHRRRAQLLIKVAIGLPVGTVTDQVRVHARRILADIRQALSDGAKQNFPTGVTSLELGGRSFFVREDGSRYFRPELRLRVTFTEHHRSIP